MDNLRQTQFQTSIEVVEHDIRKPPSTIGAALGSTEEMLHILRIRSERRTCEPLLVTEAWLPADLFDTLSIAALRRKPLYKLLSGAGFVVDQMQHEITTEIAALATQSFSARRSVRRCFASTDSRSPTTCVVGPLSGTPD